MICVLPANRVPLVGKEISMDGRCSYDSVLESIGGCDVPVAYVQTTSAHTNTSYVLQSSQDYQDVLRMSLCGNLILIGYYSFPKNDEALRGLLN